jgi:histidinol-phosphatase (PHP family)
MRDYHIHTSLCKHAEGDIHEYVELAIELGMTEICFTDHNPFNDNFDPGHRMAEREMELYMNTIQMCRGKYREISILTGIEMDYIEGYEEYIEDFTGQYPFDIVIMAVHYIKHWTEKNWVFAYEYTEDTLPEQYHDYFEAVAKGIATGLFDVVGHLDIIKRPGYPVMDTNAEDVEGILDMTKEAGMSIELNTSGLRKYINETYPTMDIMARAVEKEIPVILSSDAHKPEQVGYCFDDIFNQLFQYPKLQLAQYRQRQIVSHNLSFSS